LNAKRITRIGSLAVAAFAVVLVACNPSSLTPYTFDASYRMISSPGEYQIAPDCAAYGELVVRDHREDTAVIGVRYLEDGNEKHDVGMEGDVEAWLRSAMLSALEQARIEQEGGSSHTITLTLDSIVTDEAVYRRAEYDARVVVKVEVAGGGADWSANKSGFSENYGYAGSAENYQETVNHAIDKALVSAINDPGFRDALCK
jgi:hypothetical protein